MRCVSRSGARARAHPSGTKPLRGRAQLNLTIRPFDGLRDWLAGNALNPAHALFAETVTAPNRALLEERDVVGAWARSEASFSAQVAVTSTGSSGSVPCSSRAVWMRVTRCWRC